MKKFLVGLVALIACVGMSACTPFTVDGAEKKLEKAGYEVSIHEADSIMAATLGNPDGLVSYVTAAKAEGVLGLEGEMLMAAYFESILDAKDYYNSGNTADDAKWEGKWVYWGTEEAMEEFGKLF